LKVITKNYYEIFFQRPAFTKPKLGKVPSYLFEEGLPTLKANSVTRNFENQIEKTPNRINSITRDFFQSYFENLKEFVITFPVRDEIEVGKQIVDNINKYSILREEFINFFSKLSRNEYQFDIEILIKFLEKLPLFKRPLDERSSWSDYEFDNFRFITHELFLYLITISLKNENYKLVEELLYSSYFLHDKYEIKKEPSRFDCFYNYARNFDAYYKQTYSQDYFSPMADLIIKRIPDSITKAEVVQADLLCHYISKLQNLRWFPITYVYKTDGNFELYERLISLRHFEKVKIIFAVQTVQELKDLLTKTKANDKDANSVRYSNSFDSVRPIYEVINIEKIGTTR
jgi:hypothetical protein